MPGSLGGVQARKPPKIVPPLPPRKLGLVSTGGNAIVAEGIDVKVVRGNILIRTAPKLSKDEQERHKSEGLCYICHKSGHFSRNCPDRHKVSSSSKPPGVSSFGIDVDFGDVEAQRQLAISSGSDLKVMSNFIHLRGPGEPNTDDPDDDLPDLESVWSDDDVYNRAQFYGERIKGPTIGSPLEDRAAECLSGICYPGDDPNSLGTFMDTRFVVYSIGDGKHVIIESEQDVLGPDDRITIDTELLRRPAFRIDSWYWFRKGELAGIPKHELRQMDRDRVWQSRPIGRPVEDAVISKLREHSLPIIEDGNRDRFECSKRDKETYLVYDYHLFLCLELASHRLEYREFDVVQWHAARIHRACIRLTITDPFDDDDFDLGCPATDCCGRERLHPESPKAFGDCRTYQWPPSTGPYRHGIPGFGKTPHYSAGRARFTIQSKLRQKL